MSLSQAERDDYLTLRPRLRELLNERIEKKNAKELELTDQRNSGRPCGIPTDLAAHKHYRKYHNFQIEQAGLPSSTARYIKGLIEESHGIKEAEKFFQSYRNYLVAHEYFHAKRHKFRGITSKNRIKSEKVIEDYFGPISFFNNLLLDPLAFYDSVSGTIDSFASSDRQKDAIKLAHAVHGYLESSSFSGKLTSIDHYRTSYCAQVARLGGWAGQQVGQYDWLSYFNSKLKSYIKSGDRIANVSYWMLHFHNDLSGFHLNGINPRQNSAAEAHKAYKMLSVGPLGFIHDVDATIYGNPASFLVRMGQGAEVRIGNGIDHTVEYFLNKSLELDYASKDNCLSHVSTLSALTSAYSNSGMYAEALRTKQEGFEAMQKFDGRVSCLTRRNWLVAAGELEAATTGHIINSYLLEARDLSIELGNLHRAAGIERSMGIR